MGRTAGGAGGRNVRGAEPHGKARGGSAQEIEDGLEGFGGGVCLDGHGDLPFEFGWRIAFHTFKVDRRMKMSMAAMDLFKTKIKNCVISRKYS